MNEDRDRYKHKGKKPKLSFDELLAKYLKENEAKCANQSNDVKSSRVPPKRNSGNWNWQGGKFLSASSYSPLGPSMSVPYAPHRTSFILIHHGGGMIYGHILLHILDHIM
jgi:hypothetical protein